jgi:hypothetical protein
MSEQNKQQYPSEAQALHQWFKIKPTHRGTASDSQGSYLGNRRLMNILAFCFNF